MFLVLGLLRTRVKRWRIQLPREIDDIPGKLSVEKSLRAGSSRQALSECKSSRERQTYVRLLALIVYDTKPDNTKTRHGGRSPRRVSNDRIQASLEITHGDAILPVCKICERREIDVVGDETDRPVSHQGVNPT